MSRNQEYEPEPNESEDRTLEKLLSSPDVQKAIAQIPDLIKTNIQAKNDLLKAQLESQTGTTRGATKWILGWSAAVALVIVLSISFLSWYGKISSDATTFVFGTIVGAAFTFLRNFFPRGA